MAEALDKVKLEMIEAKAGSIVDRGYSDSYSPPVVVRLAEETLELSAEVRRLQAMEDRLKSLMVYKRERIVKDRRLAAEQGDSWLGVNSHTVAANLLDTELQNLERVLNGA